MMREKCIARLLREPVTASAPEVPEINKRK
jgi:hypothetical protein